MIDPQLSVKTTTIVSKIAFLIGVEERHFYNPEDERLNNKVFKDLAADQNARIIRNLCILRNSFLHNYKAIDSAIKFDLKNIDTMPDLVPTEAVTQLEKDGIRVAKVNAKAEYYMPLINRLIQERFSSIKDLIPSWANYDYIKTFFIMPRGTEVNGVKSAFDKFHGNLNSYPYHCYANIKIYEEGNILTNDIRFLNFLFEDNGDHFTKNEMVHDVAEAGKEEIYDFIDSRSRVVIVVDCENSNVYRFMGMLQSLKGEHLSGHIHQIILYDDVNTPSGWTYVRDFTSIPVEYNLLDRVKQDKSYMDIAVSVGICKRFYEEKIDGVLLFSSDSDYWGLISMMQDLPFYLVFEKEKTSNQLENKVMTEGIRYCWLNQFYQGDGDAFKFAMLKKEAQDRLADLFKEFSPQVLFDEAVYNVRANLSDAEKKRFYDKLIKPMRLVLGDDGIMRIELGDF